MSTKLEFWLYMKKTERIFCSENYFISSRTIEFIKSSSFHHIPAHQDAKADENSKNNETKETKEANQEDGKAEES